MVDTGGGRQEEEWASRMAVCGGGGTCAVLELSGN